jgi:hypothetical protein
MVKTVISLNEMGYGVETAFMIYVTDEKGRVCVV